MASRQQFSSDVWLGETTSRDIKWYHKPGSVAMATPRQRDITRPGLKCFPPAWRHFLPPPASGLGQDPSPFRPSRRPRCIALTWAASLASGSSPAASEGSQRTSSTMVPYKRSTNPVCNGDFYRSFRTTRCRRLQVRGMIGNVVL